MASGGAWYNNWGDLGRVFTHDLPNEFSDPNSNLRSGQFGNRVQGFLNNPLLRSGATALGPEALAAYEGVRSGVQGFRDLTGLGYYEGGAREKGVPVKFAASERALEGMFQRPAEGREALRASQARARQMMSRLAPLPDDGRQMPDMGFQVSKRRKTSKRSIFSFINYLPPSYNAGFASSWSGSQAARSWL
jgi:hypothetical protein